MTTHQAITKAIRRRALREALPPPLNLIALRYVDSVAALDDDRRSILSMAIRKTDLRHTASFIDVLNKGAVLIQNEDDLIALIPSPSSKKVQKPARKVPPCEVNPADTDYLMNLLLRCYPDMPQASADALSRSAVMETSLRVVRETRNAIQDAASEFVLVTLFTLFEEKLIELRGLINGNPAFVKAAQLSRPDWDQIQNKYQS